MYDCCVTNVRELYAQAAREGEPVAGVRLGQLCKGAGDAVPVKARKRMMMIVKC